MNRFPAPFRQPTRLAATLRRLSVAALIVVPITACGPVSDEDTTAASNGDTTAAPTTPSAGSSARGPATGSVPFGGKEDVVATVSLPAGWATWSVFVLKDDTDPATGLAFYNVGNIYSDPCRWVQLDPPVGPSVDDLVAAFEQSTVFQATSATDVTVDGYPGKYFQVTVPDYNEEKCAKFGLFREAGSNNVTPNLWAQAPSETLEMWVLDVNGTRLVVGAGHYPHTPDEDLDDITEMVDTLNIG